MISKVNEVIEIVEDDAYTIEEVVQQLVSQYCGNLDDFMEHIETQLNNPSYPVSDEELENFALKLPNLLYFTGEAVESIGIREDIAKGIKQDLYNKVHMSSSGTVADKNAKAESETKMEYIVHSAYQRAYKKIKLRMEAGYEMLNSVKKVMSRRMLEVQLTMDSQGNNYPIKNRNRDYE